MTSTPTAQFTTPTLTTWWRSTGEDFIAADRDDTTGNELAFDSDYYNVGRKVISNTYLSLVLTIACSNISSSIPTGPSTLEFYPHLSSMALSRWGTPASPPATVYEVIPRGQSLDLSTASHVNAGNGFDSAVNIRSGHAILLRCQPWKCLWNGRKHRCP